MEKKEIIVLGGGISGLSLLWYLRKLFPDRSLLLLDKADRVGGVVQQVVQEDVIFDQGPKTFRVSSGGSILELIDEVHLQDQLLFSSPQANKKYLYFDRKLHAMSLGSSVTLKMLPGLCKEPFVRKALQGDETIGAFMRRRFGNYIADSCVQPFVAGICGGDMHKLSMQAYFPTLKKWEEEKGSVVKGMLLKKSSKKKRQSSLFTLRGGLATLTTALGHLMKDHIRLRHQVHEIKQVGKQLELYTNQGAFLAEEVFSALPIGALRQIQLPFAKKLGFFYDFPVASLVSVSFAYKEDVLQRKGFGYLVPAKEKEKILGVLFDKATFPMLDSSSYLTKLTVMMGGSLHPEMIDFSDEQLVQVASDALFRHLGISEKPCRYLVSRYPESIPQYPLYHGQRLEQLLAYLRQTCPHFKLAGSYLTQASVAACIEHSKNLAYEYARC